MFISLTRNILIENRGLRVTNTCDMVVATKCTWNLIAYEILQPRFDAPDYIRRG